MWNIWEKGQFVKENKIQLGFSIRFENIQGNKCKDVDKIEEEKKKKHRKARKVP